MFLNKHEFDCGSCVTQVSDLEFIQFDLFGEPYRGITAIFWISSELRSRTGRKYAWTHDARSWNSIGVWTVV